MYTKYSKLRNEKGLTDYQVCKATGIPPSVISYWKNGKTTPKTDKLVKIAALLETSIDNLIKEE